jgi:hypothetical protein
MSRGVASRGRARGSMVRPAWQSPPRRAGRRIARCASGARTRCRPPQSLGSTTARALCRTGRSNRSIAPSPIPDGSRAPGTTVSLRRARPIPKYVEIVGVIATVVSIDTFCRAIGVPPHPLPQSLPGTPHRRRPRTAQQRGEAWVPLIHPKDLEGNLDTEEERVLARYWSGVLANIRRALSLVPEEAYAWFQLVEIQYLSGKWMRDFQNEYRAISHAQIELMAGRVSVLNQCFY